MQRFLKNISDLNNFKDLFNLYKWKKAAYDLYSNLIVTNDNYFHKVFENIGYAWGFPIEKSGPVGFLSNNLEEKKLQDDNYQSLIAYAIYLGILNYLDSN